MDEMPGDLKASPTRLRSDPSPQEYALALMAALELAARNGGRAAFDRLFDRGFDRLYAWSYLRVGGNPERAQALTMKLLMRAARALAQHEAAADDTAVCEPGR